MENVFWALVVGFSVVAFLLDGTLDEIAICNDVREVKDELKKELGFHGTLNSQLIDIEKAINKIPR
ncbi:MAG: hypothetical protein ABSC63_20050 [Candidatus Binataceae bacterium]|jgi:hypothetical protein